MAQRAGYRMPSEEVCHTTMEPGDFFNLYKNEPGHMHGSGQWGNGERNREPESLTEDGRRQRFQLVQGSELPVVAPGIGRGS